MAQPSARLRRWLPAVLSLAVIATLCVPVMAQAATSKGKVGPHVFSTAQKVGQSASCTFSRKRLTKVAVQAPQARMRAYWAQPHNGRVAVSQYVEFIADLQGLKGSHWSQVARQHSYTLVKNKMQQLPALPPFTGSSALHAGYSAYRVVETLDWLRPTDNKKEGSASVKITHYRNRGQWGRACVYRFPKITATSLPVAHIGTNYRTVLTSSPSALTWTIASKPVSGFKLTRRGVFRGMVAGSPRSASLSVHAADTSGLTDTAPFKLSIKYAAGDVNGDGVTTCTDYNLIRTNFGKTKATHRTGDLSGDGTVNNVDYADFLKAYKGKDCSRWTVQRSPSPSSADGVTQGNDLEDVSCVSSNYCIAVGQAYLDNAYVPIAERWNGTNWTRLSVPNPTTAPHATLLSVSCVSTKFCMATGQYEAPSTEGAPYLPLAEKWDGSQWKVVSTPNPKFSFDTQLSGVSCASASRCVAVGEQSATSAVIEVWNGQAWSFQNVPAPPDGSRDELAGVSCAAANACLAVGQEVNVADAFGGTRTLSLSYNGSRWTVLTTPSPSASFGSALNGVSCGSASSCMAVGSSDDDPLAERWNGTKWALVTVRVVTSSTQTSLASVSCTADSFTCIAVGSVDSASAAVVWHGAAFTPEVVPARSGTDDNSLNGVSCLSSFTATAVGLTPNSTLAVQHD
jgi:hypothetical protein